MTETHTISISEMPHNGLPRQWHSGAQPIYKFKYEDQVEKIGGDYSFIGSVRCSFQKASGQIRVVVENDDGLCHIFNEGQLVKWPA